MTCGVIFGTSVGRRKESGTLSDSGVLAAFVCAVRGRAPPGLGEGGRGGYGGYGCGVVVFDSVRVRAMTRGKYVPKVTGALAM
ncbi:hypothetical protein ACFVXC_14530 [Streptomyces sp. NPDC058257]|uniref:hypothetical protein n=1 Tax=Streptomyces sp. NPDC058257 TaxID=3346409 RepID=UPI0036E85857